MTAVHAQTVNPPPIPQWLSGTEVSPDQTIHLRKTFHAELPLLKAILMGASDSTMSIRLNGALIGKVTGREQTTTFDVTAHVKQGSNVLTATTTSTNGVALLLELNGDLARKSWVASDSTWLASSDKTEEEIPSNAWRAARSHGRVDTKHHNPFAAELALDAYNSWKLALKTNQATDAASFTLLPGFKAELLRSAQPGEGSWITLAFDPKGRLTVARESRGLLRFTLKGNQVERVEVIDDTLLECRGLVYAHGALYVNANNSKGFYRLRDTDGDDQFDETRILLQTKGGVGHGRNRVVLGPDGALWLVHGNDVVAPSNVTNSALQHYAHDALIPCPFDDAMFDGSVVLPAGHILRADADGKTFQLFAGGFRNPLDVAFNRDGEMFTFDADMEWDVGSPWYRPNRVNHVISGADYGWRRGTSKWPDYFPETLPSTLDIGLASPTGVEFGTGTHFPPPYNDALYIADWAYGRILAVHLEATGVTYRASSELFVAGRPLNVTDLTFGPDGAMYFTTGGRGTQSGLYRISHASPPQNTPRTLPRQTEEAPARKLRRRLESFHSRSPDVNPAAIVAEVWPHLGHNDPAIRHAARVALEHLDSTIWQERALTEPKPNIALTALLALARVGPPELKKPVLERLNSLSEAADRRLAVSWLRAIELALTRMGQPDASLTQRLQATLEARYPSPDWQANHRLCVLLVCLRSPVVLPRTLELLSQSQRSEDTMHYLFYLRYVRDGWTIAQREQWFRGVDRARKHQGARDYFTVLNRIRDDMLASLSDADKAALRPVLSNDNASPATGPAQLPFVKEWRMEDFDALQSTGSVAHGEAAFRLAQCNTCHRFGSDGALVGPDLTDVGARFDRRALLESIIHPSNVIDDKYRQTLFILKDGTTILGTVEREDASTTLIREGTPDGPATHVARDEIARHESSTVSPMPNGLLNGLQRQQIVDLLAFLQSGGTTNRAAAK